MLERLYIGPLIRKFTGSYPLIRARTKLYFLRNRRMAHEAALVAKEIDTLVCRDTNLAI